MLPACLMCLRERLRAGQVNRLSCILEKKASKNLSDPNNKLGEDAPFSFTGCISFASL